ncbi:MAG: TIR domain-containing protein, partial [bacterium]|nr:TIR domain-containing protein [bacterium]
MTSEPPKVFISYSHADEAWKDLLVKQLKVLELEDVLEVWDDRRIAAGDDWLPAIEEEMARARVALFLVSADFLTSEFIRKKEVPELMERRSGGLRVIPVIVDSCPWRRVAWLAAMQCRPKDGKALALMADAVANAALAELAEEIADLLDGEPATPSPITPATEPRVSIAKLPATGEHFVAREAELARLDTAWDDEATNVISFVAMGGAGKSALVNHWLDAVAADGWRGAERVLGWSFYSQGTESAGASSEAFTEAALEWLGYDGEPILSPWKKGEVVARLVRERRTLLLLDGLEPLQHPPGEQTGRLKDPALQALVKELAAQNPGLCVISTRLEVADVAGRVGAAAVDLDRLPPAAGAELLRQLGVEGSKRELRKASEEFGGHALALALLGTYLRDVCDGDVRRRSEVALLDQGIEQGGHARRVMKSYEAWLGEGPELRVLRLMGLFDRPADADAIAALRADPPIPGLTDGLGDETRWRQVLARLRQARLLAPAEVAGGLDAHPLVREHFGERLRDEDPEAWRAGHERLYEHYKQATDELPETLEAMMPLYAAVVHGCRAGRVQESFDDVYRARIHRRDEFFSLMK